MMQRIVGTRQQVAHAVDVLTRAGRVRWMSPPRQAPDGRLVVEVLLSDPAGRRALTAVAVRRRWWDRLPRVDGAWTGWVIVGLATVAGLGWVLWQAVTSTARWAADHTPHLVGVAFLAAVAGGWWAISRLRRTTRGCPGVSHCTGCTHH